MNAAYVPVYVVHTPVYLESRPFPNLPHTALWLSTETRKGRLCQPELGKKNLLSPDRAVCDINIKDTYTSFNKFTLLLQQWKSFKSVHCRSFSTAEEFLKP